MSLCRPLPLWLALGPAAIALAAPGVPPGWLWRPAASAVLLASAWGLAGYARLRRRGLMQADPVVNSLAVLAALHAVLLLWRDPPAAALLAGPEMACLWFLSASVCPASLHVRAWRWPAGLLGAAIAAALAWNLSLSS